MATASPDPEQPVEGERIGQSRTRKFRWLRAWLAAIVLGGLAAWAWWAEVPLDKMRLSAYAGVLGGLSCLMGLLGTPLLVRLLVHRRELILGDNRLQILEDGAKVLTQVPYDNIAGIKLVEEPTGKVIDVELVDRHDAHTLNAGGQSLAGRWHYRLTDYCWSVPMNQIYEKLNAKVGPSRPHDPLEHVRWAR